MFKLVKKDEKSIPNIYTWRNPSKMGIFMGFNSAFSTDDWYIFESNPKENWEVEEQQKQGLNL